MGKSVIIKFFIQEIRSQTSSDSEILVFIFCGKHPKTCEAACILQSLLYQILVGNSRLLRFVDGEVLRRTIADEKLNIGVWTQIISRVVSNASGVTFKIFIDALDEIPQSEREILLKHLANLVKEDLIGRLKIIVTDRTRPREHLHSLFAKNYYLLNWNPASSTKTSDYSYRIRSETSASRTRFRKRSASR